MSNNNIRSAGGWTSFKAKGMQRKHKKEMNAS